MRRLYDWLFRLRPDQQRRSVWLEAEYARRWETTRMTGLCREARRLARINAVLTTALEATETDGGHWSQGEIAALLQIADRARLCSQNRPFWPKKG